MDSIKINYQIQHVKNGKYQIKVQKISSLEGSALDEWIKMGQVENLTISDVEYLKRVATARVVIWESNVDAETLNFETKLTPNEIQYIHITYRY